MDWGLVEYATAEDAERAQTELNGHGLRGHNIRITYYIPGVRAINLFLKLLNEQVMLWNNLILVFIQLLLNCFNC